ncbi:hypothetical protein CCP2SC5_1220007 [Azospirillaceae bacterium]
MTTPEEDAKPKPADSAFRYLLQAPDEERQRWGKRAVELGFPAEKLRTGATAAAVMPWLDLVREEMRAEGLWESPQEPAQIVKLPIWSEPVRAVPNDILRSALFSAIQGKTRRFIDKEEIASIGGIVIKYYGMTLDQADLDVWEQAVHLARSQPLGNICKFRANAFLKGIGRSNGKNDYNWLDDSITRLVGCAIEIRNGSKVFTGSLLSSCVKNVKTGEYELTLDPKMIVLYSANTWTGIEWEQRQSLRGKPLALWLHGYFSSHAAPFPVKVATLRELSGSETKDIFGFRRKLKGALDELVAIGALDSWKIDAKTDLVTVDRGAAVTASQKRLLDKSRQE